MNQLNICIAGLGNVGSHLISTISDSDSYIQKKASLQFNILGISARNKSKKRIFNINAYNWYDNPLDLIDIDNVNVLVELIGEEKGISFELIKKALEKKIHVVTANKALLAKNGFELFKIAEKNNVLLLYEAAVAGGIPIIKTLKNNIFLNKVIKISGILNGTTNYILTTMDQKNLSFSNVLKIAKSKGYTSDSESELDIGGIDSAHKLTLLATLCFGVVINFDYNDIIGLSSIQIEDIVHAKKLGFKIKLISEAYIKNDKIYYITGPKLIHKSNSLASTDGVLNAIKIETDQLESLFLEGEGAGGKATASSVISDLFEIFTGSKLPSLGYPIEKLLQYQKPDILDIETPFYLRIMTADNAGVLSKITGYFKDFDISIEKILQLPDDDRKDKVVPIIITTHKINREKLTKAITQIEKQKFVLEKIIMIAIEQK